MAGMKLTGEYEFTDDGVRIVGTVHDSKIADLRQALRTKPHVDMYLGDHLGVFGDAYKVIHPNAINAWKHAGIISPDAIKEALSLKCVIPAGSNATEDLQNAGIYLARGWTQLMSTRLVAYYADAGGWNRRCTRRVNMFNVGWVYSHTQSDGSFDVTLKGLCNRHILTMLIQRATAFSKFLDGPMVKVLDHPTAIQSVNQRTVDYGYYGEP